MLLRSTIRRNFTNGSRILVLVAFPIYRLPVVIANGLNLIIKQCVNFLLSANSCASTAVESRKKQRYNERTLMKARDYHPRLIVYVEIRAKLPPSITQHGDRRLVQSRDNKNDTVRTIEPTQREKFTAESGSPWRGRRYISLINDRDTGYIYINTKRLRTDQALRRTR